MSVLREVLERLLEALEKSDFAQIKQIGQDAARDAFVYEDKELVEASLVAYSLYKLSQKHYITRSKEYKEFVADVREGLHACTDGGDPGKTVHTLMGQVHALSQRFGRFAQSTVEKGRLRAAAQMYAHGASLTSAVELSGAPLSQAANYIGGTKIAEKYETMNISIRMQKVRSLFA